MEWLFGVLILALFIGIPLSIWLIFKQYFRFQQQQEFYNQQKERDTTILPLKLQALERLTLLCNRIDLVDLVLRTQTPGTTAGELKSALLLTVQQEFEHNVTQQLYVSEPLWTVLKQVQERTMDMIVSAGEGLASAAPAEEYVRKILDMVSAEPTLPNQIAIRAVRTEASRYL